MRTPASLSGSAEPSPRRAEPRAAADVGTADGLLATMASIRRRVRRLPGRPVLLATLTGAQLELVRLVRRHPGVSVAEAAAELRLAPNTVSTLVGQLTETDTLLRRPDQADRRVVRLELTPSTRRRVEGWRDRRTLALGRAIAALDPDERHQLAAAVSVLEKLDDVLCAELAVPEEDDH